MQMSSVFGPTIQGEGKSSGMKVMFVRLSLCNLHCIWCDTPYTWNWTGTIFKHLEKFDKNKEVKIQSVADIIAELQKHEVKAVVISGGEPMLQQKELTILVSELKQLGYWVEVETNGTIAPTTTFLSLIDQINCSPKLANSGDPYQLRTRVVPLVALATSKKANFKFVVSSDEDIPEILDLVKRFSMQEVYLMPEGITAQALTAREAQVRELCIKYGFCFTQRLHIIELGGGRYI